MRAAAALPKVPICGARRWPGGIASLSSTCRCVESALGTAVGLSVTPPMASPTRDLSPMADHLDVVGHLLGEAGSESAWR